MFFELLLHNQHLSGAAGDDAITYISMDIEIWRFQLEAWIVHIHKFNVGDTWKSNLKVGYKSAKFTIAIKLNYKS